MKFAFIENRYKTIFWACLASELRGRGHEVVWLVQNPIFSPPGEASKSIFTLSFPDRADRTAPVTANTLNRVRKADRNVNYFGGNDQHYFIYQATIEKWLDHECPDVVVGESTLFHELIVIDACRKRNIIYFHPSMPGYPGGRFSIYASDTKQTLGVSGDVPSDADCLAMAEAIRKRERIPEYMLLPSGKEPERNYPLPRSAKDRLTILRGYIAGERYNTPAPWKKWLLDQQVKQRLKLWQQIAAAKLGAGNGMRLALYPLQMQPEANLDVWGQEFRDQAKLVRQLADGLPDGWHLRVKANPKSKYELNEELMNVLRTHPRVSPIPITDSMASVFSEVDLVCTVTGTVAVECVLSGKPLAQFGPSVVESGPGCAQLGSAADIADVAVNVESGIYKLASDEDRIRLVKKLYATTFPGRISDPLHLPLVMATDNVRAVVNSILEVARKCV